MSYIRYEKSSDGIVELVFDQPGKSVNVMGEAYDAAMKEAVGRLEKEKDQLKGVYLRSGKPGHFFAGGDITSMLSMDLNPSPAEKQKLFDGMVAAKKPLRTLETLGVPVAVGINGAALGGGYEIALACHYRLAVDDPKVRIGLPESQLGLMPGAGGVVRLSRLLGIQPALELISSGRQLKPAQAKEKGLVHELVASEEQMHQRARAWLIAHPEARQPWDEDGWAMPGGAPGDPALQGLMFLGPVNVMNRTKGNMPAQQAIIAALSDCARVDVDNALEIESRYFLRLLLDQTARNMMTTFFVQMNELGSGASRPAAEQHPRSRFRRIGILGAGQMGSGIALCAARAGFEVVLKDMDQERADQGRSYSQKVLEKDKRVSSDQRREILERIQTVSDVEKMAGCDLIIEAVFEDPEVKAVVTRETEAVLDEGAVFASNTSALPISKLATVSARPAQFIGLHFFSPAEKMPLVEIIRGRETSDEALARSFDFVLDLGKRPIVVKDSPGFFTSRVFGKGITEGVRMLAEGVNPALIESAAKFAGAPVGPLAVSDEISQATGFLIMEQRRKDAEMRIRETLKCEPHGSGVRPARQDLWRGLL